MNDDIGTGPLDQVLKTHLDTRHGALPSNFSFKVMESIRLRSLNARVIRARREALWDSSLVTVIAAVLGALLLAATLTYMNLSWELPVLVDGFLQALLMLAGFFILDTFLQQKGRSTNARSAGT